MASYSDGFMVIQAEQFDHNKWHKDITPWNDNFRPRDMSWGALIGSIGPNHVRDGDWIITLPNGEKTICEDKIFRVLYKKLEEGTL